MKKQTNEARIFKALNTARGVTSPGIRTEVLARKAKVSKDELYRRIYDLRQDGLDIYLNRKNGESFYRLAA